VELQIRKWSFFSTKLYRENIESYLSGLGYSDYFQGPCEKKGIFCTDPLLQGVSEKGPRGLSCKAFDDCVMFHLFNVFPQNAAGQEKYYLRNVLKINTTQSIIMHQFVQRMEQLNSYIAQLPCWFYSPSAKPTTITANVPFTEADLVSHILQMCPLMWQDQFNLHKKGTASVDMCSLLMSLEAIECICI
jgi:hypothetical protein